MRIVMICLLLIASGVHAKVDEKDFAVPESPAFQLITLNPSTILRPTTVKELGMAASNFTGDGVSFSIPKELGVEFAPFSLIWAKKDSDLATGPKSSIKCVPASLAPFLYRLRMSVAAKRDTSKDATEGQPSQIAFGLRLNFIDHADSRTNSTKNMSNPEKTEDKN
jgi:hypothetical protein